MLISIHRTSSRTGDPEGCPLPVPPSKIALLAAPDRPVLTLKGTFGDGALKLDQENDFEYIMAGEVPGGAGHGDYNGLGPLVLLLA